MTGLTDLDRAILELERSWWKHQGAKESAILDRLGMSATVYYRRLNWIIDQPNALAHDPIGVRRLRRLRDARRATQRPDARRLA